MKGHLSQKLAEASTFVTWGNILTSEQFKGYRLYQRYWLTEIVSSREAENVFCQRLECWVFWGIFTRRVRLNRSRFHFRKLLTAAEPVELIIAASCMCMFSWSGEYRSLHECIPFLHFHSFRSFVRMNNLLSFLSHDSCDKKWRVI